MPTRQADDAEIPDAEAGSDLGARLRHAREAQGLAIDDLATELRIGAGSLAALEACRFDALGAPVFAKGYLKQYGARLGLDVGELVRIFESAAGASRFEMAPLRKIRMRDERQITLWILAGLALALLLVFLAWWWLGRGNALPDLVGLFSRGDNAAVAASADPAPAADEARGSERPAPPPAAAARPGGAGATAATAPAAAAAALPTVRDTGARGATELPATTATPGAAQATATAESPVAVVPDEAAAESSAALPAPEPPQQASNAESASGAGSGTVGEEAQPAAIAGPALEVAFIEDSWAEIVDEDGNRLFYNLGRAGTRARFPADRNLSLLFGNARGIELSLDGEPLALPGARRSGQVVAIDLAALIE